MRNFINEGLFAGEVVITDTLMTSYSITSSNILSEAVKRAFRIDIWCHRSDVITETESNTRLGMDVDTQIRLHGNRSILNPFKSDIKWFSLIPVTESVELQHENVNIADSFLAIVVLPTLDPPCNFIKIPFLILLDDRTLRILSELRSLTNFVCDS